MNTFTQDLKRGSIGEERIESFLKSKNNTVVNVSNNPEYYHKGDLIVNDLLVEIKADSRISRTQNLFLEYERDYFNYVDAGWFVRTEADYLFYLCSCSNECYVYSMRELKDYITQHPGSFDIKECDDGYKVVRAYALHKDCLPHQTFRLEVA